MEFTNTLLFRRSFAQKSSQLVIYFILLALVTCNFVVEQHAIFTWLGLVDLLLAILVWTLIAYKKVVNYSAHLVIASCWIYIFPLLLISGGVDSHFVFLLPISPLMAGLLFNNRVAIILCVFLLLNIVILELVTPLLPNYAYPDVAADQQPLKAYWLAFATLISTVFVTYFHRFNRMTSRMLRDQALRDPLTGIFNRRSLSELLDVNHELAMKNGTWMSLIMADIDDFKKINDDYGHLAGDECLKAIAETINRSMRKDTDAVGRWGGEEFLVILAGADAQRTAEIAEQIRRNIAELVVTVDQVTISMTATLGCYSGHNGDLPASEEMINRADMAMYEGKNNGKNQVRSYSG